MTGSLSGVLPSSTVEGVAQYSQLSCQESLKSSALLCLTRSSGSLVPSVSPSSLFYTCNFTYVKFKFKHLTPTEGEIQCLNTNLT